MRKTFLSIRKFLIETIQAVKNNSLLSKISKSRRIGFLILIFFMTVYFMVTYRILPFDIPYNHINKWKLLLRFVVIFISILLGYFLLIEREIKSCPRRGGTKIFFVFLAFSIIMMAAIFYLDLPLKSSPDIVEQFEQAVTEKYNNWHPAAHTFLFYTIPIKLFGESIYSVVVYQYLFIAVVTAYLGYSFYAFGIKKSIIFLMYFLLFANNKLRIMISYAWKDIPFSFSVLLFTLSIMWIYKSKGEWLKDKKNLILFLASVLLIMFMRHNGIVAVVPTIIVLLLVYKNIRKILIISMASVVVFFLMISGPFYNLLNITKHSNTFSETVGVPNNQLSYIVKYGGDVSEEELEFIDNIVPIDIIKSKYKDGDFNSIKRYTDENGERYYDGDFIENNSGKFISIWLSVMKKNIKLSLKSYYHTIIPLFGSNLGISDSITYNTGMGFFVATIFIFAAAFNDRKKLIAYLPMFLNMAAIMLLVTGGEMRFVLANITCGVPIALFALFVREDRHVGEVTVES